MKSLLRALLMLWPVGISLAWIWAGIELPEGTLPFGVALIIVLAVGAFLTVKVKGNLLGPLLLVGASAGLVYDVGTVFAEFSLGRATPLPLEHFAAATAPPLVVAASTLTVAALFNPARKRVQGWVDRRFNRSHYDAQRVAADFAGSLRDRVEVGDAIAGWTGAVSQTMQPPAIGVWVRD